MGTSSWCDDLCYAILCIVHPDIFLGDDNLQQIYHPIVSENDCVFKVDEMEISLMEI